MEGFAVANPQGKIFGLIPCDLRTPTPGRARERSWNPEDERFLVPTFFGMGWTANLRNAPHHPFQAGLLLALILWRMRARRSC